MGCWLSVPGKSAYTAIRPHRPAVPANNRQSRTDNRHHDHVHMRGARRRGMLRIVGPVPTTVEADMLKLLILFPLMMLGAVLAMSVALPLLAVSRVQDSKERD